MEAYKRVLLLSTHDNAPDYSDRSMILAHLGEAIATPDVEVTAMMFEDLVLTIRDGVPAIMQRGTGQDVAAYDLVYVKNWKAHQGTASALAVYLEARGVQFICSELRFFRAMDKISEAFLLSVNNVPYADTLFTVHGSDIVAIARERAADFPLPLIMKAVDGSAGTDNYLVRSYEAMESIIAQNSHLQFMVQNYIPNDSDDRIIMLGYQPKLAFRRRRLDDTTHLNNTSQGGSAEMVTLDTYGHEVIEHAVRAAQLVHREIAGVDVIFNTDTGQHVILEVNASPQLATGAFLDDKRRILRDYFQELLYGKEQS